MKDYFVLISDEYWGVFKISDSEYPSEMLENMFCVHTVSERDLKKFLIEHLGRNILINKNFHPVYSIGQLFSAKPS